MLFVESFLLLDEGHTSSGSGPVKFVNARCRDDTLLPHTGSSSQAAINAWYGFLKDEVEIPLRSSKTFGADMMVVSFGKPRSALRSDSQALVYVWTESR